MVVAVVASDGLTSQTTKPCSFSGALFCAEISKPSVSFCPRAVLAAAPEPPVDQLRIFALHSAMNRLTFVHQQKAHVRHL